MHASHLAFFAVATSGACTGHRAGAQKKEDTVLHKTTTPEQAVRADLREALDMLRSQLDKCPAIDDLHLGNGGCPERRGISGSGP
jgi:hypothetical protein